MIFPFIIEQCVLDLRFPPIHLQRLDAASASEVGRSQDATSSTLVLLIPSALLQMNHLASNTPTSVYTFKTLSELCLPSLNWMLKIEPCSTSGQALCY